MTEPKGYTREQVGSWIEIVEELEWPTLRAMLIDLRARLDAEATPGDLISRDAVRRILDPLIAAYDPADQASIALRDVLAEVGALPATERCAECEWSDAPYVCPDCHAVGEPCPSWCPERRRRDDAEDEAMRDRDEP